eukprot:scaffold976_cov214-Ochromonas_danica.AAC.5
MEYALCYGGIHGTILVTWNPRSNPYDMESMESMEFPNTDEVENHENWNELLLSVTLGTTAVIQKRTSWRSLIV